MRAAKCTIVLVASALALLLGAASALAAHPYLESFGPDGSETTDFGETFGSRAVAIDQGNGTIYVGNQETIVKFDGAHQPANFSGLGTNKITGVPTRIAEGRSQLAVDSTSHRIYATSGPTSSSLNSIRAFEPSGLPASFSGLGGASEITVTGGLCGVAVDSSGNIYAGEFEAKRVTVFAPSGTEITSFAVNEVPLFPESGPCNLGVDATGHVYVNHWASSVEKFTPSAFPVTGLTTYASAGTVDPGQDRSLAVNTTSGHLYVLRAVTIFGGVNAETKVIEYDASGTEVPPPFGNTEPGKLHLSAGIAVKGSAGTERIYASDLLGQKRVEIFGASVVVPEAETLPASNVAKTTAKLNGRVNAKGAQLTVCKFEYGTTTAYGQSIPCQSVDGNPIPPAALPSDSADHTVSAQPAGLTVNTKYHYRFVAGNEAASAPPGADKTFETLGPPVIEAESAGAITTTSAQIAGTINPRGEATSFAVQYVSAAQFAVNGYTEATTVPVPFKAVGSGLVGVAVAWEIGGLAPGTSYHYRLLAQNLTDPVVQGNDQVLTTFASAGQILPDQRRYELVSPVVKAGEVFPPETQGGLGGTCEECLPGVGRVKMPMQPTPDGGAVAYEGQAFGAGTAAELNEYIGERGPGGWATEGISKPEYIASGLFEDQNTGFLAFSEDLGRGVIMQQLPPLSPQAPPGYADLYLWERGGTVTPLVTQAPPHREPGHLVVVYGGANAGTEAAGAFTHVIFEANDALIGEVAGIAPPAPEVGASERNLYEWVGGQLRLVNVLPGNGGAVADAVIGSGRLAAFNATTEGPDFDNAISADGSKIFWSAKASGQLYIRENGKKTVAVPDAGRYLSASTDGARVLLSNGHLYDTTTAVPSQVADLTAGQGGFEGTLGASEDLGRIYFVDSKALAGENGEHKSPAAGKDNLYLWEGGATSFIATLQSGDNLLGGQLVGDWRPARSFRTAQVSGDGRYAAFMSEAALTGYDNRQREGKGCQEQGFGKITCAQVFSYDAATHKLTCASCNPSGERPRGYSNLSLVTFGLRATFITEPRNLTENGRLFFESQDSLSSDDTNGQIQDVYEWEPAGVGDCQQAGGCLALISTGHSANDSQFFGATPSGDDAYIVTRQRLLPRDKDEMLDLYDARVEGGFPEAEEGACVGEGCRGQLPAPPPQPNPGSAGFSGPGNPPAPCRSGYVRKQGKCVKQKHKKKHKHKQQQKRHARGAGK